MKSPIRKNIIKSMVKKEFKQLLRDPRMRGILFGSPLLMILLFGYAVNTDVKHVKIAVLDEDKSSISRHIIEKFTASEYFDYYAYLNSEKEMEQLLNSGEAEVFIHIRNDLFKRLKSSKESEIQIIIDGANSSRASIINAYVSEIMNTLFFEIYIKKIKAAVLNRFYSTPMNFDEISFGGVKLKKGINLKERIFFNPSLLSRNFYLPGVIALLISLITIMLTSMSIVKERETGTIEQVIVSPLKPLEYILGKTVPFAIVGIVDMIIVTFITIFWFSVPFNGSFVFLLISGFFFILSTLSVGLYISTISKTQQQAMLSFFLFFVPAILFSGFVFPIYSMPKTIQVITLFNPLMYFINIIRGIFLKGIGFSDLWFHMFILFIMGLLLIYLSVGRFKKRLE